MKFKFFASLFASLLLVGCSEEHESKVSLIPLPKEVKHEKGTIEVSSNSEIYVSDASLEPLGALISERLSTIIDVQSKAKKTINLELDPSLSIGNEGYELSTADGIVTIQAKTAHGIFYGVQTLLQLIEQNDEGTNKFLLPKLVVKDEPRFSYRGMHLDVSRNFFSTEFVKKYIDIMAMYKLNTLHWHLTDGAGWRIEIKKYPLLTQKAAFRKEANWKSFWFGDRKFATEGDENVYGGYYSQDEVKDIVAYAQSKFVTIIPEIEMPGHSEEVFVAYPDLCCSKKPYVNSDFCPGNEAVFEFLDGVLSEVIELFPSEYIHVGGDEAGKDAWKKCPLCSKRMKTENLKDVDELQSYFMKRVESIVESKGRKIIGWDEILEGGLPPRATVMSWRGEEGGIKAAKEGHDIIMTPGGFCYFDTYQADPTTEPEAIGGYVTLKKVYSYEPIPAELTDGLEKHILGIQACIWTEYVPTETHLEYMVFPRMLAMAETAWSAKGTKEWGYFKHRLFDHFPILDKKGVNYYKPRYEIEMLTNVDKQKEEISVKLDTEQDKPTIHYTIDGSDPTITSELYKDSIVLKGSHTLKAAIFENGELKQPVLEKPVNYHKAIGKTVKYATNWGKPYPAGGETALVDGYRGGMGYGDGRWQGFTNNIDVTIDLGSVIDVKKVSAKFMQLTGPGVYMPTYFEVYTSVDGVTFEAPSKDDNDVSQDIAKLTFKDFGVELQNRKAQFIRVFAKNPKGYIFTDEIIIE